MGHPPGGVITEIIDASGDGAGNGLDLPLPPAVDGAGNVYVVGQDSDNLFRISFAAEAPTATATPTATRTPLPSGSPTRPPATSTPGPCYGDCGSDGLVTVDDLIRAVNIALGNATLSTCTPADVDGDGHVTVDELIKAVNAALGGCVGPLP